EYPEAGLIFDASGNLYSTTSRGGGSTNCSVEGCGTVFELSPSGGGKWTETVLNSFQGENDRDLANLPHSGGILDSTGHFYGTTSYGGTTGCNGRGCGVVYEVSKAPRVSFSPTSLSYGDQTPGSTSDPQVVTLTNSGALPLAIASIQIAGANGS